MAAKFNCAVILAPSMPAYYASSVSDFVGDDPRNVFSAVLAANEGFAAVWRSAITVWQDEIPYLQTVLRRLANDRDTSEWGIILEFAIPRRQKRIDAVILGAGCIFVIEFKTAESTSASAQVEDYALDLAAFHAGSTDRTIVPVVVTPSSDFVLPERVDDSLVLRPGSCSRDNLDGYLDQCAELFASAANVAWKEWINAEYRPIPSIVDAARAIFAGMEVREIAHAQSGAENLTATVDTLVEIVDSAVQQNAKVICFVTGVPGSGKTLAGLRAVHDDRLRQVSGSDPAFFSGNGPLVKILREALIRDAVRRGDKKTNAARRITAMIQNVHQLARTCFDDPNRRAPNERLMVFDEAQRAWNAEQNQKKFQRNISEPEMILEIMSRHDGWAAIVCLVGGGQEIYTGEAGLREWGIALTHFRHWKVYASPEAINGGPAVAGSTLGTDLPVSETEHLHLNVATRTYPRAQVLNTWANSILDGDADAAKVVVSEEFPVFLTRDLGAAKTWLQRHSRGYDRCGLVASSGAARLRAFGLETSTSFHRDYPYEHWFLNPRGDVRSSYQLEVLATEFEIQGLELDFVCLCWGGDFLWSAAKDSWSYMNFVGTAWRNVHSNEARAFMRNKYRVLFTRARQTLLLWVPNGVPCDSTTTPALFDDTADFLMRAGARALPS